MLLLLRLAIIVFCFCCIPQLTFSQVDTLKTDSLKSDNNFIYKAALSTSAYYAGSMYFLSNTWYKGKKQVPFHFYNDFNGYMQIDKFGHAFGAYVYSYIGYHLLLNSGLTRNEALYFGATLGLILQTPIEIMDGLHEGYGFSWGDIAANSLGSALVLGQEIIFNEQLIKYKFSYLPSRYADKANGLYGQTFSERLLKDYNGQTYWLSFPIEKLGFKGDVPSWLNVAVGFGANGMYGEFENLASYNGVDLPNEKRYHQYLLSLDIDWSKIKTDSKFLKIILNALTFIKLPFPAVEFNSMGKIKGYWLYY